MNTTSRVETYLDDLARMLDDLEPDQRDDILGGVREHLDALVEDPSDAYAVDAALLRLGPPEHVAAAARRELGKPSATAPRSHPAAPAARPLVVNAALVLTSISSIVPLLLALWTRVVGLVDQQSTGGGMFGLFPTEVLILTVLLAPLWVLALICTLAARELPAPARRDLALAGPVAFATAMVAGLWNSPATMSALVASALALASLIWVVRVVGRARHDSSHAPTPSERTTPRSL